MAGLLEGLVQLCKAVLMPSVSPIGGRLVLCVYSLVPSRPPDGPLGSHPGPLVVPSVSQQGTGLQNEALEHKKEAFNARIKALDSKNEALGPKRGVRSIKMRDWKLRMQLGP